MINSEQSYYYKIGGLILKVSIKDILLELASGSGSHKFLINYANTLGHDNVYSVLYSLSENIKIPDTVPAFTVRSFDENKTSYEWDVYDLEEEQLMIIRNEDGPFKLVSVSFYFKERHVEVKMVGEVYEKLYFDPFFQPFGVLLLNYLVHQEGGIMLHSSGVKDGNNGYVFTAVSGTGKSTMAGLWQSVGGKIINDDRLILMPGEDGVVMTNTPMPYYQDVYKESPVTAVFLIKQSPENHIKPLPGVTGVAGLMANCIQFLYDKEMVKKHMESLTAIAERCPIYELGFKPDTEIVEIIRREFGRKQ